MVTNAGAREALEYQIGFPYVLAIRNGYSHINIFIARPCHASGSRRAAHEVQHIPKKKHLFVMWPDGLFGLWGLSGMWTSANMQG